MRWGGREGGGGVPRILCGGVKEIYKLKRQKWTEEPVTGQYDKNKGGKSHGITLTKDGRS